MNETLVGRKVKRLSDGEEVTIKSERVLDGISIYTDTDGNIYTEEELDIRYKVTPWYLMYEALRDNELMGMTAWGKHSNLFKLAFHDFMEAMQKAGYIAREEEEHED